MKFFSRSEKEISQLAGPLILSQIGMFAMILVDTVMVGRLGELALAAVGLGSLLFFTYLSVAVGILSAMDTYVTHAFGQRDESTASHWLGQGFLMATLLSVLGFFTIRFFASNLVFFNIESPIAAEAFEYTRSLSYCLFPYTYFVVFRQYLAAIHHVRVTTLTLLFALLLNAFLNWIFIYGNLGSSSMGVFGAGLATSLTRFFMLAVLLVFFMWMNNLRTPFFKPPKFHLNSQAIQKFLSLGLPAGSKAFIRSTYFFIVGLWVARLGATQMAAHTVCTNIGSFLYMISVGLSVATSLLVGKSAGEKNPIATSSFVKGGLKLSVWASLIVSFLLILFRVPLLTLFSLKNDVLQTAATLILFLAALQLFDFFQAVGTAALRAVAMARGPLIANGFSLWFIGLPLSYFFGLIQGGGLNGIWFGFVAGIGILSFAILAQVVGVFFLAPHERVVDA